MFVFSGLSTAFECDMQLEDFTLQELHTFIPVACLGNCNVI